MKTNLPWSPWCAALINQFFPTPQTGIPVLQTVVRLGEDVDGVLFYFMAGGVFDSIIKIPNNGN